MKVLVQDKDFDIAAEVKEICGERTDIGAIVTFTGLVRDFHGSNKIEKMTLEHFPGMAEKQLEAICTSAEQRWPLLGGVVIHRTGPLTPGDQIVVVITLSAHRQAAFEAAEFIMDWLKTEAPFWKKELSSEGNHWVEAKESDAENCKKWQQ